MPISVGGSVITDIGKITVGAANVQSVWVGNVQIWPAGGSGGGWILRTSGVTETLEGVAYGNSIFVAVGSGGRIISSPDGKIWTTRSSGVTNALLSVRFLNGAFYAVGIDKILRSTNGTSWSTVYTTTNQSYFSDIAYGGGVYLVVGYRSSIGISARSTDGTSWASGVSWANAASAVTYYSGNFITVGRFEYVDTSTDGLTKTSAKSGTGQATDWSYDVFYDSSVSRYVYAGLNNKIVTSTNLSTWTTSTPPGNLYFRRAFKSTRDGRYLFFGTGMKIHGGSAITGSLSMTNELDAGDTGAIRAISGTATIDVAVGSNGVIYTREV